MNNNNNNQTTTTTTTTTKQQPNTTSSSISLQSKLQKLFGAFIVHILQKICQIFSKQTTMVE